MVSDVVGIIKGSDFEVVRQFVWVKMCIIEKVWLLVMVVSSAISGTSMKKIRKSHII